MSGCYPDTSPSPHAAVEILTALMDDRDAAVRRTAAEALGKIGDPTTAPVLLQALRDADSLVRAAASRSLGGLATGSQPVQSALLALLKDSDSSVRSSAAQALGMVDPLPGLAESLAGLLASPEVFVRRSAAHALQLADVSTPMVADALSRALSDPDPVVRQWAVAALAETGDARAGSLLIERLLKDRAESVQAEAAYRLGFIGDKAVAAGLKTVLEQGGSVDVRRWVEKSLAALMTPSGSD